MSSPDPISQPFKGPRLFSCWGLGRGRGGSSPLVTSGNLGYLELLEVGILCATILEVTGFGIERDDLEALLPLRKGLLSQSEGSQSGYCLGPWKLLLRTGNFHGGILRGFLKVESPAPVNEVEGGLLVLLNRP